VMLSSPSTNFSSRLITPSNLSASCIAHRVTFQAEVSFWCFRIRLLNRSNDSLKILIPREADTSGPRKTSAFMPYLSSTRPASSRSDFMFQSIRSTPGLISGRSRFLSYRRGRSLLGLGTSPTDSPQRPNRARCNENYIQVTKSAEFLHKEH